MTPRTHVFAVAVETYLDTRITPVIYGENDANMFTKAWHALGVDPKDCDLLLSSNATYKSFESHLKKFLNHVAKGERVVFFYAGHGIAINGESRITMYDTQLGDIQATTIKLGEILQQVRNSRSNQVLLFFDSCESGLPITPGMRSIYTRFSPDELEAFCSNSEYHFAFASCKVGESSYPSRKLAHGIWSHCVIQSLNGQAKPALDKGRFVTGTSLQGYVVDMVPRILRVTYAGKETQTPCAFGNFTKEFVVADLTQILADRAANASTRGAFLKDSSLRGIVGGPIRRLSGFKKGHRVPDSHFAAAGTFVKRIGDEEIKKQANHIFDALRADFGYVRKDMDCSFDTGASTIKTPDFDVNISIEQDEDDCASYTITTEVTNIRKPDAILRDEFSKIFSRYCDNVVIGLARALDLNEKIDQIEAIPELKPHVDYDANADFFTLDLLTQGIRLTVRSTEIAIELLHHGDIKALLANSKEGLKRLGGSGVALLLPEKTSP
jgi:hypothetical protein